MTVDQILRRLAMNQTLRLTVSRAIAMLAVTLFTAALVFGSEIGLTGPAPSIRPFTIDAGGGTSTGGTFAISGTIGQPDALSTGGTGGGLTGGTFIVVGGFWPGSVSPAPTCLADITGNAAVDIDDLLAVINAWGGCPTPPTPCTADIAPPGGNGIINIDDLLAVINGWGLCR
jgi:hypothetical protein